MTILTRRYGEVITSVNTRQRTDWRPILQAIISWSEEHPELRQKAVTAALNVSEPTFGRWKKSLEGEGPIYPNESTRDAITDLLQPAGDRRREGMQWSAEQMRKVVGNLEQAVWVRRELRGRLAAAISPPEGRAVTPGEVGDLEGVEADGARPPGDDEDEDATGTG